MNIDSFCDKTKRKVSIDSNELDYKWDYILSTNETINSLKNSMIINKKLEKITIYEKEDEWYEGEVDEFFIKNGQGIYYYSGGDTYDGEFENGLRHGFGEYKYSHDESIYRGEWFKDMKQGYGSYKFGIYELCGKFENDKFISGFVFKSRINDNADNEDFDNFLNSEFDNPNEKKIFFAEKSFIGSPLTFGKDSPDSYRKNSDFTLDDSISNDVNIKKVINYFDTIPNHSKSIDINSIKINTPTKDKKTFRKFHHSTNNSLIDLDFCLNKSMNRIMKHKKAESKVLIKAFNFNDSFTDF